MDDFSVVRELDARRGEIAGPPRLLMRSSSPQLMQQVLDLPMGAAYFTAIGYFRSLRARPFRQGVLVLKRCRGRPRQH